METPADAEEDGNRLFRVDVLGALPVTETGPGKTQSTVNYLWTITSRHG